MEHCQRTMLVGGMGIIAGTLLAWVSLFIYNGQTNFYGLAGDGILLLGSGLAISFLAFSTRILPDRPCSLKTSLMATVALLIASPALFSVTELDVSGDLKSPLPHLIAAGLILALLGSLTSIVSGILRSQDPSTEADGL